MFNKNQNSQSNSSQIPVHTMQDDLNALQNPNAKGKFIKIEESNFPKNDSNVSEKKSDSPFLNGNIGNSNHPVSAPVSSSPSPFSASAPIKNTSIPVRPIMQNSTQPKTPPIPQGLPVSDSKDQKVKDEKEMFLKELAEKREIEREEKQKNTISEDEAKKSGRSGRLLLLIAGVVIVITFFLGGYYFWITKYNQSEEKEVSEIPVKETQENTEIQNIEEKSSENATKFSITNPNILSLDIENPDYSVIKQALLKTAADIKAEKINVPLEFIVTDKNNAPVSFVNFTLAFGIKLPAEILSYAENDFSLYFFNDNEKMRLGLAVKVREADKVKALVRKEESKLYSDFSSLFIENIVLKTKTPVFADGNYNGIATRYANLDEQMTASLDYGFKEDQFVLGTSKQTMRSILDKLATK